MNRKHNNIGIEQRRQLVINETWTQKMVVKRRYTQHNRNQNLAALTRMSHSQGLGDDTALYALRAPFKLRCESVLQFGFGHLAQYAVCRGGEPGDAAVSAVIAVLQLKYCVEVN
jgi:hypothetical protein